MNLFHAVIVCPRDGNLARWHVEHVDDLKLPIGHRYFYCGIPTQGEACKLDGNYQVYEIPFLELYENLPLKTYGLMKHALTFPEWTHLLKTDINSYPAFADLKMVEQHHLVGYRGISKPAGRTNHFPKVHQQGLTEPHLGPLPDCWVGGPAYIASRTLAEKIVARGPWYARGWPYEDVMVSQIALEHGWPAQPGVSYWTDGRV